MVVDIRRGTHRFTERLQGRLTQHAFSFGAQYDADHVRFGPMVCHDDHLLRNGEGFPDHEHADLAIVTYVVSGAVAHTGPGGAATLTAGQSAVFRTGPGATHAEVAAGNQTRFVQVWLTDPEPPALAVVRAGHRDPGRGAARRDVLGPARRRPRDRRRSRRAPKVHAYVARGALLRSSMAEPLHEGDAFLFTDEPAHEVTAGVPTELLVWQFTARLRSEPASPRHAITASAPGRTSTTAGSPASGGRAPSGSPSPPTGTPRVESARARRGGR